MGRPRINGEAMPARMPTGTKARMTRVLKPKEKHSDLLREALEAELTKREGRRKRRRRPAAELK